MVSQPIRLILVDWFVFHFFEVDFHFFFEVVFHFLFFLRSSSIRLSSLVKIKLHTENQLPRLPGSALKVPGWWVPPHYQVKLQLQLRLSWAVTIHLFELDTFNCVKICLVFWLFV
jgi:hypothetical protein